MRFRVLLLFWAICPLCSLGTVETALAQGNVREAVQGLQDRYRSVRTVSGSFRQTYRAPGIHQVESGIFSLMKPGLMRWEYQTPEEKLFIADGRDSYLYTPEDHQVMVQRFGKADMRNTPLDFLLGRGEILKSFSVSWETDLGARFQGTLMLHLVPLAPDAEYGSIVIECDAGTYDVRRMILRERTGNMSEFEFENLQTNKDLDRKQFVFKIPKGVEVIRLDERN